MTYCRITIDTTTRGCVYQKDFDAQHVFGPLARLFASELVRQGAITDGELYASVIRARYEDRPTEEAIPQADRAQEPRPAWLTLEFDPANADQPLALFTLELRFQESGLIYRQDLQVRDLGYFWQNLRTALLKMGVLKNGDLVIPRICFREDGDANFAREIVRFPETDESDPLVEVVEVERADSEFAVKSRADFLIADTHEVALVSPVELAELDSARQDEIQILIARPTFEALQAIARREVQIEQGGALVGHIYRDAAAEGHYLVEITDRIEAEGADANLAELRYTFESWLRQREQLKAQFPDKQIVGWYHTHLIQVALESADTGAETQTTELFFSDYDRFMHRQFFGDTWYVAMVLGPQGNAAFFRWFGDKISANRRFYIIHPEA